MPSDFIPEATQLAKKTLADGDVAGAAKQLATQLALTPEDRETQYYLAVCYRYLGDFEQALTHIRTMLELSLIHI